jgi:hypothetical protein
MKRGIAGIAVATVMGLVATVNEPVAEAVGGAESWIVCQPPAGNASGFYCLPGTQCARMPSGWSCISPSTSFTPALPFNVCTANPSVCDDKLFCNGVERCMPGAPGADPRGCLPGPRACGGNTSCDEASDTCVNTCPDRDRDGHPDASCGGPANDDCDDRDPNRFPGNPEVCDGAGHDEDCNPCTVSSSNGDGDADLDGVIARKCSNPFLTASAPACDARAVAVDGAGKRVAGRDCDDQNAAVVPGTMVCSPTGVLVCPAFGPMLQGTRTSDGWLSLACPTGTTCLRQPNGTGLCAK